MYFWTVYIYMNFTSRKASRDAYRHNQNQSAIVLTKVSGLCEDPLCQENNRDPFVIFLFFALFLPFYDEYNFHNLLYEPYLKQYIKIMHWTRDLSHNL